MQKEHPISLNMLSFNGVVKILETIRDAYPDDPASIDHIYIDTGDCIMYVHYCLFYLPQFYIIFNSWRIRVL
jgi:hypothetical protein